MAYLSGSLGYVATGRLHPLNFPIKIVASIPLFIIFLTESLVPLQSRGGFMFRRSMMGAPIFNVRTCGGMPGKSKRIQEFSWIVDNLILILHSIDGLICCRFTGYSMLNGEADGIDIDVFGC
ncbi:hypothetical protein TNCV_4271611 [Trichonephila clavipes]|nr:hypothetical protein TNCV_4271611 [Trichonephila clavipes]